MFIIDVSQSVEHDHPHALEFLRKDCTNMTDFFKKNGVCTLTVKELFDFVVDPTINADNIEVNTSDSVVVVVEYRSYIESIRQLW